MRSRSTDDTEVQVQVRPVVPDDEDRYRGRRRRPTRFDMRMIIAMIATAVVGFVLLVVGVRLLTPAHHGAHDAVVRPPGLTGPGVIFSYPPDGSEPSASGSPTVKPSVKPSPGATGRAAPPAPVGGLPTTPTIPNSPDNPPPAPPPIPPGAIASPEAETGTLGGTARVRNVSAASGGQVVGNLGNSSANTLTMNGISVPTAGSYRLTIFYIAGNGQRFATLTVNGTATQLITFAGTADWSTVASVTVTVDLKAGGNSLQFGNSTSWAPDIDRVSVR
jgi:hypothetical protein